MLDCKGCQLGNNLKKCNLIKGIITPQFWGTWVVFRAPAEIFILSSHIKYLYSLPSHIQTRLLHIITCQQDLK
jgi:hypothetical protein